MFKPIEEKDATSKVKEIFDEIKEARQITEIPNFWKTMANSPETLERTWRSLQQVMGKGELDPAVKELIYVAVSITNSCEYCIKSHTFAAKKKGATDQMLKEMIDAFSQLEVPHILPTPNATKKFNWNELQYSPLI